MNLKSICDNEKFKSKTQQQASEFCFLFTVQMQLYKLYKSNRSPQCRPLQTAAFPANDLHV